MNHARDEAPEILPSEKSQSEYKSQSKYKQRSVTVPRAGIQALKRGRSSVRGFAVREAIVLLKCTTHMTTAEIAKEIGRSIRWVNQVWAASVREAEQAKTDPKKREELKAWMVEQLKMTIIKSQNLVEEHAAYGALVYKGIDQLSILLGLDGESANDAKSSLQEIADQVDARSPLVMAKLDGIKTDADAKRVSKEL